MGVLTGVGITDGDDDSTAHELGACGGDCPDCQRERAERRESQRDYDPDRWNPAEGGNRASDDYW